MVLEQKPVTPKTAVTAVREEACGMRGEACGRGFRTASEGDECGHLDLRLPASRTARQVSALEASQGVVFVSAAPANPYTLSTISEANHLNSSGAH